MRAWTVEDIRRLTQPHSDLSDQDRPLTLSNEDFRQIGETLEAFWQNEDEPGSFPYHAIMVSGLHTNGFVNVSTVLAETNVCEILATQMIKHMRLTQGNVDFVVGPGNAAITISFEVARQLRARHGFTEKDEDGVPRKFGGRVRIQPGERVLIVNELMSTIAGSTFQCKQGILKHQAQARILPYVGVLVNRSGFDRLVDGTEVVSQCKYAMSTWAPEDCPHCKAGSTAIKPKITEENWLKLTGKGA